MKNNKALVTIALGNNYYNLWKKYAYPSWKNYAEKNGYDIVCFTNSLDNSDKATNRSASWQRCLVLNDETKKYERIVWMDADIIINPMAPSIVEMVPAEKIGGTDSYSFYSKKLFSLIYEKWIAEWKINNSKAIVNRTGKEFYNNYGIDTESNDVIDPSVMVLNPKIHKELLEYVYYHYEDKGGAEWNYEMRPLSYEIVKNNFHHFIDDRFNYILVSFLTLNYPYLHNLKYDNSFIGKLFRKIFLATNHKTLLQLATTAAFSNSYFLHFSSCMEWMPYLDQKIYQYMLFKNLELKHTDILGVQ